MATRNQRGQCGVSPMRLSRSAIAVSNHVRSSAAPWLAVISVSPRNRRASCRAVRVSVPAYSIVSTQLDLLGERVDQAVVDHQQVA